MKREEAFIINQNRHYWDTYADLWFGATALPKYGVCFATENELHLFGDVSGKKLLEICCGSGHSLKYHAERNAGELWGVDFSQKQLENAKQYLRENGYTAKLICSPMEADMDIPHRLDHRSGRYFKENRLLSEKRRRLHFQLASYAQLLRCMVLR